MEFSPMHLWESMTWIAKGVAITLVILSVYSLYVTIERYLFFKKAKKQSLDFAKQATAALAKDQVQQAVDVAKKFPASHLARVTRAGLIEFQLDSSRSSGLSGQDLVEAGRRAIERETLITYSDFKKGVGALATIATTAPFIGLFGTVIGIINAFRGMSSGAGGIAAVSGGIAEALVTTALGLFVAIPAAWMFNYFTNTLERFSVEMSNSSSELIDFFIKKHGGSDAVGVRV
ncbi:MAG: MotA/TolQ/ExbB proton channel family protein [Thermoanaerobaculia bacterium]